MSGGDPWIDMSAYPNLPPDDAVDGHTLHALRGLLHAPAEPELDPGTWNRLLDIAVHGPPDPDAAAADAQDGHGGHGAAGHGSDSHEDWRSHLGHPHGSGHGAHDNQDHANGHDDPGAHGGHGIHW
jgi:hypothetical protein